MLLICTLASLICFTGISQLNGSARKIRLGIDSPVGVRVASAKRPGTTPVCLRLPTSTMASTSVGENEAMLPWKGREIISPIRGTFMQKSPGERVSLYIPSKLCRSYNSLPRIHFRPVLAPTYNCRLRTHCQAIRIPSYPSFPVGNTALTVGRQMPAYHS